MKSNELSELKKFIDQLEAEGVNDRAFRLRVNQYMRKNNLSFYLSMTDEESKKGEDNK